MARTLERPCSVGSGIFHYMADFILDVPEEDVYQDITVAKTIKICQYTTGLFMGF